MAAITDTEARFRSMERDIETLRAQLYATENIRGTTYQQLVLLLDLLERCYEELIDDLADSAEDASPRARKAAQLHGPVSDMLRQHGRL